MIIDDIKCRGCGNTGSEGSIYILVDARWDHESGAWVMERREDLGGDELDCLNCDERTPAAELDVFPYGTEVRA